MATTFTIAIPTHNRRETVVLAVLSAVRQTLPPLEVIVLCDGCTDGTADALRALGDERIVPLELPKAPGYAYGHRNVSLARARGTAIIWLGDDDLLLPDHLERVAELWDEGTFDLVTAPAVFIDPNEEMRWMAEDWSVVRNREQLERRNASVMASVSIRVELARTIGGWDATQPRWGDWDLWKRALAAGARPAATGDVTVLQFGATGREQRWADRVAQNTAWFERLGDPSELAALRRRLARLRTQRDAALVDELAARERELAHIYGTRWWRARSLVARLAGRR